MPLPLPITHNVRGAVIDALSFSDLAEEAALGRVVDFELVDGGVPHLVLVEEAGWPGRTCQSCSQGCRSYDPWWSGSTRTTLSYQVSCYIFLPREKENIEIDPNN